VNADFCISGPDFGRETTRPRRPAGALPWNALQNAVVSFEVGGSVDHRPGVRIDVAQSRVSLALPGPPEPGGERRVIERTLPRAQLAALLAELFSPEFLEWAQAADAEYDGVGVMDGDILTLEAHDAGRWKVHCSNQFPAPLRRFGCVLSERGRNELFEFCSRERSQETENERP